VTTEPGGKILSWTAALAWRHGVARRAHTVVFTNGVFDLLHPGHIDLLRGARAQGDALVVGLNSDVSARRLNKGPGRPVRTEGERAYVLAALESVDAVVVFDEDTPRELVQHLQPDVIAKGGDYSLESVVGAEDVRARGGRVVIIPLTPGHSTTQTIERLRAASQAPAP